MDENSVFLAKLKAHLRNHISNFTEYLPYADGDTEQGFTSELLVISAKLDAEIDAFAESFKSEGGE